MSVNLPLEVLNLSKNYGSLKAVDNVSFSIKKGEIFGLLGPNGAGKTTVISTIVSLEEPSSGEVQVFGQNIRASKHSKYHLGFVPQEIINHGFFSVEEILQFHSGYYGVKNNQSRIDYLLQKLGLTEHKDKKVKQLSGGMKRRLLIAKALVHRPKLLLLDEPTAGVDIELRESLWDFVTELRKEEGLSILLTTHYLEEAEQLCDRIGFISRGKLIKIGPTSELIEGHTNRFMSIVLKPETKVKCEHQFFIKRLGDTLTFKLPYQYPVGELLASTSLKLEEIQDIKIQEGTLDDVFRQVVSGGVQ